MKVKIIAKKHNIKKLEDYLIRGGFEISDDATFTLIEENITLDSIIGRKEGSYFYIYTVDIIFFESFGHEIYVETKDNRYRVKEKLYELEEILNKKDFFRINQSMIVNKKSIKKITPSIGTKFKLTMINNTVLEVTRNYYYKFKEFLNI